MWICGFLNVLLFASCCTLLLMLSYYNVARIYWRFAIEETMRQTPNSCGTPHVGLDACSPCVENCRGWKPSFCVRMCMCACALVCSVETNINKLLHIRVEELVEFQPLRWPGFWRNSLIVTTIWPRLRLPNNLPRFLHHFDSTHHHTLWKGAALRFRNMIVFIFNLILLSWVQQQLGFTHLDHTILDSLVNFQQLSVSCLAPPKMEGQDPPKTFQATMRPFNAFTARSVSLSCWGISIASWDCPMGISLHCTWELNKNPPSSSQPLWCHGVPRPESHPPDGLRSRTQASEMHKSVHDSYLQCLVESHNQQNLRFAFLDQVNIFRTVRDTCINSEGKTNKIIIHTHLRKTNKQTTSSVDHLIQLGGHFTLPGISKNVFLWKHSQFTPYPL